MSVSKRWEREKERESESESDSESTSFERTAAKVRGQTFKPRSANQGFSSIEREWETSATKMNDWANVKGGFFYELACKCLRALFERDARTRKKEFTLSE